MTPARYSRPLLKGAMVFATFTVLALVDISQTYFLLTYTKAGGPTAEGMATVPLGYLIGRGLAEWYLWALLTPLLVWFGRRFPLDGPSWRRNLVCQALFCAVLSCEKMGLDLPFVYLFPLGPGATLDPFEVYKIYFFRLFLIYLIICVVTGVLTAVTFGVGVVGFIFLPWIYEAVMLSSEKQATLGKMARIAIRLRPFIQNTASTLTRTVI